MSRLRLLFSGAKGRMGQALLPGLRAAPDLEVVAETDVEHDLLAEARRTRAQVIVDFTTPAAALGNAHKILAAKAQGVIGTTGFSAADLDLLDREARAAGRALLIAPNFALGMLLLQRYGEELVKHFPRVEVIETHHEGKADAPSGTAQRTAERLAAAGARSAPRDGSEPARGHAVEGVRVHSLRLPGVVARQDLVFGSSGESIVLRHEALSRECYLPGVLLAVRALGAASPHVGLLRGLDALLFPGR